MKSKNSLLDRLVATLFTKPARKLRSAAFPALCLLASSFVAAPASAQYGLPTFTVGANDGSTTVVGFGGQQWYVIKDNTGSDPQSVRLLHKYTDDTFGNKEFRIFTGSVYEQPYVTNPNEYGGSTLQQYLEAQAGTLSAGEQAVLIERSKASMTDLDQMGQTFADQKLWALSRDEWSAVMGDANDYPMPDVYGGKYFWLRSPNDFDGYIAWVGVSGGGGGGDFVVDALGVRPASDLNLSSVIFTSKNDGSGKDAQLAGGGWYNYNPTPAQPARDIKFTFSDVYNATTNTTGQKTPNLTLKSGMEFDFTGATMGPNQYVSGLLHGTGLTDYYARFAETTTSGSGSFTMPTAITGADGDVYTFDVFCEQANGVNYSDFMGQWVRFEVTLDNNTATDLTLVSTDIAFGLDGGTIGLKDGYDYTQAWTLGTTGTNTINVKPGESSTISGTITGAQGSLAKDGTGRLILTNGTSNYLNTQVNDGTLEVRNLAGLGSAGANLVAETSVLDFNLQTVGSYAGQIIGDGAVKVRGTNLTLTNANNTYSGSTTLDNAAGVTLTITHAKHDNGTKAGSVGTGDIVLTQSNSNLNIELAENGELANDISGDGWLSVNNTAGTTLTLSGENSYNGIQIAAGSVVIGHEKALGSSSADLFGNGTSLISNLEQTIANTIQVYGTNTTLRAEAHLTVAGAGAPPTSFFLNNNSSLTVDAADANILAAKEVFALSTAELNKTGSGTFQVAADSDFRGTMNVNQGGFRVVDGKTFGHADSILNLAATPASASLEGNGVFVGNTATLNGTIDPTGKKLNSDGTETGSDIATLTLQYNTVTLDGATLAVDIASASSYDQIAVTGAVTITGANTINATIPTWRTGTFDLVTTTTGLTESAAPTYTVNLGSAADVHRKATVAATGTNLQLTLANQNATVYWTGAVDGNWNIETTKNWQDASTNATWFANGDTVVFGPTGSNKAVTVAPSGVSVDTMTVTGTGYTFNLTAGATPAISAMGNIDLNGSTLNITGYTPGTDVGSNVQTVITSDTGISGFNSAVKVMDQATADFLSASAYRDGNAVKVETRLTWNSTDPNRKAHGDFTVDSGTFTLGAILSDNSTSTNRRNDWNGDSLTKMGDGTLILTAANAYTGQTTVSTGTLALSGNGSIAASNGVDLASGTSFDISEISATETSVKQLSGSGDVNLGDKNLEIGSGNTSTTLSGNISGLGGSLTKTSDGTLTLSGTNTYTGGTEIEDGKIVAKNASALGSGDVYIHADKMLDLDFEGIFINEIRDSAGMDTILNVKNNVAINHANPKFTGTTNVDSEKNLTLGHEKALEGAIVNLSDASTLIVKQASSVRGLIAADATISLTVDAAKPNDAAITAADGFNLDDDTTLVVDVENVDQLENGKGNAKRILVLDGNGADEFGGTASLHSSLSRIRFSLDTATADELAYLLWLAGYADAYNSRLSRNGARMTSLIDNLPTGNGFLDRLDSLTDDAAIISGIENSTGEAYAMSMDGAVKLQRTFNDYLLARKTFTGGDQKRVILGQCDPCAPVCGRRSSYELWGQFTGGSHDRSGFSRYTGYDLSSYGVAFGIERELGRRWFGGVAFGYDNANLKLDDRHAKDEFEAFRASLYGGYAGRNWYASGYAGYSKNWHDMKRSNPVLGFSNRGKYDDDVFSTGLELGRVMKLRNGAQFIPSIGIHWIHLDNPAFSERGDTASALRLSGSHYDSVRLPLGARLNRTFTSQSIAWTPEVRAFYVAELADTRSGLNTAFASSLGSGTAYADSGSSGRSGGQFGTGVMAQLTTRLSVGIDYDYEVWEHYDRHNLTGNVTVRW